MILKDGESYNAYVMTIIGDDGYINGDSSKLAKNTYAKHDDDFSGILYYSTPQGKFVSGHILEWLRDDVQLDVKIHSMHRQ